ncbi:hypothetical protein [Klebsiella pneumoniae]
MTMWQKSAAICAAVITKPTIRKVTNAMKKLLTKLRVISAVSKAQTLTALTTAARITPMTDITELAQREKFEAWFVNDVVGADVNFPAFKDGEYTEGEIYDEQLYFMLQAMWMAWKAAGAELVEALEKSQRYIERLREWNAGLAQESCERQQRIEELESDLSEWTDCKHDGASYYDMSGQERCGRCGADV